VSLRVGSLLVALEPSGCEVVGNGAVLAELDERDKWITSGV
jgi:hypothetical protein